MEWIKTSEKLPELSTLNTYSKSVVGWNKNNYWEEIFLYKGKDGLVWIPISFNSDAKECPLDCYTYWMQITSPKQSTDLDSFEAKVGTVIYSLKSDIPRLDQDRIDRFKEYFNDFIEINYMNLSELLLVLTDVLDFKNKGILNRKILIKALSIMDEQIDQFKKGE